MSHTANAHGQPVGLPVPGWSARPCPERVTLSGHYGRIEPLDVERHAAELHAAYAAAPDGRDWTYMSIGPFEDLQSYLSHARAAAASTDPLHYAVVDRASGRALGTFALMRIDAANGVAEVGYVAFSRALQRTPISTEAQYLLMKYVFGTLGYRRYEWKCDALNAPSRRTALRLGFRYEGTFRQAMVYKGRSRDTAWFSIVDRDWAVLAAAFEAWLAPGNFDAHGAQRRSLAAIRADQVREMHDKRAAKRPAIAVRPLAAGDEDAWRPLWRDYLAFYDTRLDDAMFATTWARLTDPAEPMVALGAFDGTGRLLGIAHALYHRSCWTVGPYCYLQDLFTVPDGRGRGVGRALIEAVGAHARAAGADRVYWHTHETNTTARALYDQVATNAGFIQYRSSID